MAAERIEAENMTLNSGYVIKTRDFASNSQHIHLTELTGKATTTFNGTDGTYNVALAYHDTSNGQATIQLTIGNNDPVNLTLDQDLSSLRPSEQNLVQPVIFQGLEINPGDEIEIAASMDGTETAAIDFLEFTPVAVDTTAPTATLSATNFNTELDSTEAYTFTVTFTDDTAVDVSTLNTAIAVQDQGGNNQTVTLVGNYTNASQIVATYQLDAPGGSWDLNEAGSYTVLAANTVTDTNGKPLAGGTLGSFEVEVESNIPLVDVKVEAEDFQLGGNYSVDDNNGNGYGAASNGKVIGIDFLGGGDETGTADYTFTDASGIYNIVVTYFDESDGEGSLTASLAGNQLDSWTFDQDLGNNKVGENNKVERVVAQDTIVNTGDIFSLTGQRETGESTRVDFVEFIPAEDDNTDPDPVISGETISFSQSSRPLLARLDEDFAIELDYGRDFKLMPLGDSITEGKEDNTQDEEDREGYRRYLYQDLTEIGLDVDFVGSESNGLNNDFDKDHQGHPGWKVQEINDGRNGEGGVDDWIPAAEPDIVLLKIGTNNGGSNGTNIAGKLDDLVEDIFDINSFDGHLIVSTAAPIHPDSIYYDSRSGNIDDYNDLIPGIVNNYNAIGEEISFVDIRSGDNPITEDDMSPPSVDNGLHPTAAGYEKMASSYYEAVLEASGTKTDFNNISNIVGSDFDDLIVGNNNANEILGGEGDDELTGGGGADQFIYTKLADGRDTLTDFDPTEGDLFQINASGFVGSGLEAGTALSDGTASPTGVFVSGINPQAVGSSANVLYNTSTGILSLDIDGVGVQAPTELALLQGAPNLTVNQFEIA
ncbi:MAG: GDSL-type esterase/lipase family protein [Microcoleaceae cyanobacterium]